MLFLDPHTRELYADWELEAERSVASLRLVAGRHPDDRYLAELIGELSMKSPEFARLWSGHSVLNCSFGTKLFQHPEIGRLELGFEVVQFPDGSAHRLLMYTATAGTPSAAASSCSSAAPHRTPADLQGKGLGAPGGRVAAPCPERTPPCVSNMWSRHPPYWPWSR